MSSSNASRQSVVGTFFLLFFVTRFTVPTVCRAKSNSKNFHCGQSLQCRQAFDDLFYWVKTMPWKINFCMTPSKLSCPFDAFYAELQNCLVHWNTDQLGELRIQGRLKTKLCVALSNPWLKTRDSLNVLSGHFPFVVICASVAKLHVWPVHKKPLFFSVCMCFCVNVGLG